MTYKKKYKFDYQAFANGLEAACVTKVRKELNLEIPMTQDKIKRIYSCMRRQYKANRHYEDFTEYHSLLAKYNRLARKANGTIMVKMDPALQWKTLLAIETRGQDKLDFEVAREITKWFGVTRSRAKVFKDFSPADEREGCLNDVYDGTTYDTFTLDHVGLLAEDQVALESAIFNNKWDKRNLVA